VNLAIYISYRVYINIYVQSNLYIKIIEIL